MKPIAILGILINFLLRHYRSNQPALGDTQLEARALGNTLC